MYHYNQAGGFRNFRRQKSRPSRGHGGFRNKIDKSFYVKKAQEFSTIEEVVTVHSFDDFGFCGQLVENIKTKGYVKATEIQDKVIPEIMAGRDVLGVANTGTGKTAAYILPLINKIINHPEERVIILAPTRELAVQIKEELRSFTWGLKVFTTLAIGGAFIREQIIKIKRGPNVIIGTPGRIMDLGKRRVIDFKGLDVVILDEVDRMLDMGFIGDVKAIVEQTPQDRQTLFFSATVDKKVEPLIGMFLHNPVKISTKIQDTSSHIEQNVVRVPRSAKEEKLHQLVAQPDFKKVLIFGSTQLIVEKLSTGLIQKGFRAQGLHGGKRQYQRQQIVKSFREDQTTILVATDVAARGLDIADITHVINYDEPNNYQDYIHRIGRTGRGNNRGCALTFVE